MAEKKRYWLKLEKDFLKSKYIKIIKDVDNGNDYILFYLALMLESVDSVGHLRFTELVPYNEKMLSSLTDTNIDIVRSAMKLFIDLGLIKLLEDGTFFIPDVPRLTGKESESAERVRQFRVRKSQKALPSNGNVTNCNDNKEKQEQEQEEKQKQEEKENIRVYSRFLETWNQQKPLPTHSDEVVSKNWMKKHDIEVKLYSDDQIIKAIENYSTVISHPDKYYFSYKWNLWDFIMRGLDKFIDDVGPLNNFKKETKQIKQRYSSEPDSGLGVEDYEGRSM